MKSKLLFRLIAFMGKLGVYLVLAVAFAVLGFFASLAIPYFLTKEVFRSDQLAQTPGLLLLLGLLGLALLRGLARYGEHYFGHYVAFRVLADYRKVLYQKLRKLSPSKLDEQESGHLLKLISEDIEALEVFFAHTLAPVSTALVVSLFLLPFFAGQDPLFALVAGLCYLVLALVLPILFASGLSREMERQRRQRLAYAQDFLDKLKGMRELLQFHQAGSAFADLEQQSQVVNACEREVAKKEQSQRSLSFFVVALSILAMVGIGSWRLTQGVLSLEQLSLVLVVFSASFAPYLELNRLPIGYKRAIQAAEHVFKLLDEEEVAQTGVVLERRLECLGADQLHFSYERRAQEVLSGVSLHCEAGRIIGIKGESGSGKSSLLKLWMAWYRPTEGQLLYNQRPCQLATREAQLRFAYVPQEAQLFRQSLRENLTLGRTDLDDERLWSVLEAVKLADRVRQNPKGLELALDSEQTYFSSGEQQRLELARALLKEADVYCFDEPTSKLDAGNEASLLQLIRQHCKGLVLLVSHRASTLAFADEVYELDQGRLKKVS